MRISARGFNTGRTLYAHVVRRRFQRTIKIGRVKGACAKFTGRKVLFSSRTASGVYRVQFDTSRRYHASTDVKIRYRVTISRGPQASAAGPAWLRLG